LPEDWRERVGDMIRGVAPVDGALFAGGPWLSPEAQVEVYAEQFRLRTWDVLAEDVAGTLHLLGDDGEDVLRAYLLDHPPDTWTLSGLARELSGWLARRGAPAEQVEMAWLDRAVQEAFVAAEGRTPTAEEVATASIRGVRLRLQPHVRLRRLTTNVHLVRMDLSSPETRDAPRAVGPADVHLVVYRAATLRVRHLEVEPGAFAILAALGQDGAPLEVAIGAALAVDDRPADLPARLQGWFKSFTERGLIELVD
jgi:hypothetical protein